MHPEDELEALLNTRVRKPMWSGHVSDEVAPLLTAAARLAPLRDATPDSAFAADLEQRLMARMRQRPASISAAGAEAPVRRSLRFFRASPRAAWAAVAAALLLTVGLGALTAKAAPGAPLYVVRQLAQTLAAQALSEPTHDPFAALNQARADLAAFNAAISRGAQPDALTALSKLHSDDAQAAQRIRAMTDAATRESAQTQLSAFRQGAEGDLRASLTALDWQGRAQVTSELRMWGDADLVVTQVRILQDTANGQNKGQGAPGNATLLIEARGAGFAQGAQALVDGKPVGTVISLTPTQIVVRVAASALNPRGASELTIGVANPDGTVAFNPHAQRDDHNAPDATETPNPGDHNSDHTGSSNGNVEPTSTEDANATRTPSPNESASPMPTGGS